MIRQVVVGIDGSKDSFDAFKQAMVIAGKNKTAIKAVFVIDIRKTQVPIVYAGAAYDASFERIYIPPDPDLRRMYERMAADIRKFGENCLKKCQEDAEQKGIPISSVITEGYPAEQLYEEARSGDLLIIGQRGENAPYKKGIVGSTTEDIARVAPRPVLVCPSYRKDIDRVLFAYDKSPTAETALQFYVNTVNKLASDFILLYIGEKTSEDCLQEEVRYLKKHNIPARLIIRSGHPVQTVIDAAEEESADVILVGAQGKNKIKDYILGSTTANLLRKSSIPVLIVY